MKRILYIFFILSLTLLGCSHNKDKFSEKNISDSLSIYFELANKDTLSYEKRLKYADKAYKILENQSNDSLHRKNLFKVANRYYNTKNYEKYKNATSEILKKSIAENDAVDIAKAYSYMGDYYANMPKKDSSYYYYKKAEKLYIKLDDKIKLGSLYVNMASVQSYERDFLGSEVSAIKALDALRDTEDYEKIFDVYILLGFITNEVKNYEKSLEYNTKALNIAIKHNLTETNQIALALNNNGYIYQVHNNHTLALQKFEEALKSKDIEKNHDLHAILTDNIAYSKFKLKDYSELPYLFYKSLNIRDSLNFTVGITYNKIHLSEFYIATHDTLKAKKLASEAFDLAKSTKNHKGILSSLKQLIIVDPNNASYYSNEHIKLSDSLQLAERRAKDKFARINFETDEYITQNGKLNEQNRKIILAGIIVVLFGAMVFVIKSQRSKNKETLLKQKQQKANEEIYQLILDQQIQFNEGREKEKKRIAKELHDGIMNKLAGIRFNLFILEKKTDPQTISKCIDHVSEIQHVEKEIRNIAHDLHQDVFASKNDYAELLKTLVGNLDEIAELKIYLELDPKINWEIIPAVIKMHIYRILQEAINNSIKHSHAEIVTVTVIAQNKTLAIEIRDNGLGFDTQKESDSLGIKNMKYRTAEIKGSFKIDSSDKGTNLLITIPIEI